MSVRWITGDVFDGLATLEDGSIDLVVTSPPFLALRSYLPADHPSKAKEIGSEATPAAFLDVLLAVTAELGRVLAPHGSIAVELGDTYAGSGGAGGDYGLDGWRAGQPGASGSMKHERKHKVDGWGPFRDEWDGKKQGGGDGWPLAKSKTLIPELYRIALAYGFNPLTGEESPAGRWRVRNVVTWCRPNPPVGALGDKWRPATSDIVVACRSGKRFWDDLATRRPHQVSPEERPRQMRTARSDIPEVLGAPSGDGFSNEGNPSGAPLLDYWEIPPTGYAGAHYAVYPPALVEPLVKAMCPERVCRVCGEPSRRIVGSERDFTYRKNHGSHNTLLRPTGDFRSAGRSDYWTEGFTDCGHDDWRPGIVLDPFAGSGTTLAVASGHGHDTIGVDLDPRNEELARERVGPLMWDA